MDTEIDAALPIFFFGLRQTRKAARHVGSNIAVIVFSYAIEFIGNESESNLIGSVKTAKRFKYGAAESRVAGRISGEGRSKIRAVQITCRRAQWGKNWIANCARIAVAAAGRSGAGVRFADRGNGSPKIVMVFGFPNGDRGIGHGYVDQREQAGEFYWTEVRLVSDVDTNLIIEAWRCAKTWRSIIGPEYTDKCLLGRALRRCDSAITAEIFHFVVSGCILRACHVRRRRR